MPRCDGRAGNKDQPARTPLCPALASWAPSTYPPLLFLPFYYHTLNPDPPDPLSSFLAIKLAFACFARQPRGAGDRPARRPCLPSSPALGRQCVLAGNCYSYLLCRAQSDGTDNDWGGVAPGRGVVHGARMRGVCFFSGAFRDVFCWLGLLFFPTVQGPLPGLTGPLKCGSRNYFFDA